jgi:DNA-binding NarL/FixJ family response regulator
MPTTVTLVIAHPKELIRAGLRTMLAKPGLKVVGEAETATNTLSLVKKHKPDVLIADASIPGGDCFDLLRTIQKAVPGTKFVVLSVLDNPTYMARAKAAGASNFLLESAGQKELVTAIQNAAAGKPASGAGPFAKVTASMAARDTRATRDAGVTPREEQVLRHIAFGLSNDEISQSLEISVETVKEHVQNLLRKLSVNDRTQAAVWAVQSKLV